tara:strand:- start:512 stop:748 length:237 start_codon:yes stop_codon:yes gene_type:complete
MIHELKIKSEYLIEVIEGRKPFELRKDDRDYKTGDFLHLRGYHDGRYNHLETVKEIIYIFRGGEYGLEKGFAILGLKM